jgi:uncharacterized protein YeaO (DUF488 family)
VGHSHRVIKTKRWNDPKEGDDGSRLLVCRYRPRGVRREDETWDSWLPQLGPSKELHAAVYGKHGSPISWDEYAARYLEEMKSQTFWIKALHDRAKRGETLTLLCSSACEDPERCHRTLLRDLIQRVVDRPAPHPVATRAAR